MAQQTAVEYLVEQLKRIGFSTNNLIEFENEVIIAKAMEKEHIETAWHDGNILGRNGWVEEEYNTGSQYYKQTYGGNK